MRSARTHSTETIGLTHLQSTHCYVHTRQLYHLQKVCIFKVPTYFQSNCSAYSFHHRLVSPHSSASTPLQSLATQPHEFLGCSLLLPPGLHSLHHTTSGDPTSLPNAGWILHLLCWKQVIRPIPVCLCIVLGRWGPSRALCPAHSNAAFIPQLREQCFLP